MLVFGLTVALIGMGTVFVALIVLVGFINLMSWATGLSKKAKNLKGEAAVGIIAMPAPIPAAASHAVPTPIAAGDDGEIHAVIAAAVAAYNRKP